MSLRNETVVAAMSGGVDSSCAAYLLKNEGYRVIGISLKLWPKEECGFYRPRACCSLEGIADARLVAEKLEIPFYVLDIHKEFRREVIDYFSREYLNARTPNPCILCNEKIKFGCLMRKANQLRAESVATGHYARVGFDKRRGTFILREGIDRARDQSYMLFSLSQEQLAHAKFPLGDKKKPWARKCIKKLGLSIYNKAGSQEICFVEDDYRKILKKRFPDKIRSGPILDESGKRLGTHEGIAFYTVGQRERLRIPYKHPLYVIRIDKERNEIVVGPRQSKFLKSAELDGVNWIVEPKREAIRAGVRIRYQHKKAAATLNRVSADRVHVEFDRPQESPAPGQAAVFYRGDLVLGGGWIL